MNIFEVIPERTLETLSEAYAAAIAKIADRPEEFRTLTNDFGIAFMSVYGQFTWVQGNEVRMEKKMKAQFIISQRRGEINVIVKDLLTDPMIALVKYDRMAVADPRLYAAMWQGGSYTPDPRHFMDKLGMTLFELPRGLTAKPFSEGSSEVAYVTKNHMILGHINTDTAYMVTSPYVIVSEAALEPVAPDVKEKPAILDVLWLRPEEFLELVRTEDPEGLVVDAFTMGCLNMARLHWKGLPDTEENRPWRDLANRM